MLLRLQHGITKKSEKRDLSHYNFLSTHMFTAQTWLVVLIVHKCCLIIDVYLLGLLLFSLGMASWVIKSHAVQGFWKFTQHNNGVRSAVYIQLCRGDVNTCKKAQTGNCVFLWWLQDRVPENVKKNKIKSC